MTKVLLTVFLFLLVAPSASEANTDFQENSMGIVTFTFETVKGDLYDEDGNCLGERELTLYGKCNGFLVRKGYKIYFITVLHISRRYKDSKYKLNDSGVNYIFVPFETQTSRKCEIELVKSKRILNGPFLDEDFFEGDDIRDPSRSRTGETIDLLRIDVSDKVPSEIKNAIVDYKDLARLNIGSPKDNKAILAGYPATSSGDIRRCYEERPVTIDLDKATFRKLVPLKEVNEKPRVFYLADQTYHGDCGRPIVMEFNSKHYILGLIKTCIENCPRSLAQDGLRIIDLIDS
ncbi:MAG: hypothetical protein PHE61_02515 [Candidatus Omnitrophica bacterium]|nr:hypothetical protein [Candidatus Omnitrophota bacterium]